MPSGRRSRELRTHPGTPRTRSRRASPRVLLIGAAAVAALAVVIVLAVVLSGGSSTKVTNAPAAGSLANALPGAAEVETLFKGIPQHGTTLGSQSAPVTMIEYVDAQCPYCRMFETQVLPDIVRRYVRTGKAEDRLAHVGVHRSRLVPRASGCPRRGEARPRLQLPRAGRSTSRARRTAAGSATA